MHCGKRILFYSAGHSAWNDNYLCVHVIHIYSLCVGYNN